MNTELEDLLAEFKVLTQCMIQAAEQEDQDSMEANLKNRQDIIEKIGAMQVSREEFLKTAGGMQLGELETQLTQALKAYRDKLKSEMVNLNKSKVARNSYSGQLLSNAKIFSKKI